MTAPASITALQPILHPPPSIQIPILADVTKAVSARYGCLKRDAGIALRGLYIINPEVGVWSDVEWVGGMTR